MLYYPSSFEQMNALCLCIQGRHYMTDSSRCHSSKRVHYHANHAPLVNIGDYRIMVIYRMNEFEPIELRTREKITSPTKVATTIAAI